MKTLLPFFVFSGLKSNDVWMNTGREMMNIRIHKKLKKRFKHRTAPGTAPGTLKSIDSGEKTELRLTHYNEEHEKEVALNSFNDLQLHPGTDHVYWLDVVGLDDTNLIEAIGERFQLHPLALEDTVHVHQRPKVDDYESHLYIVARMTNALDCPDTEQVSIFLGKNFVVTFQEKKGDCFEAVRERIRQNRRIRSKQADYLAYALLDAIVDNYFPLIEEYRERLDKLEDSLTRFKTEDAMGELHEIRRDLRLLRKVSWQHREALNSVIRLDHPLIEKETSLYLLDCYDHCVQLLDVTEGYREYCTDLRDLHLAEVSLRTNEVMKVLTLIATLFMPMSFVAGLYGMNFDYDASKYNMPETHWTYGYPFALGIMLVIGLSLLSFFWRKGWIGGRRKL